MNDREDEGVGNEKLKQLGNKGKKRKRKKEKGRTKKKEMVSGRKLKGREYPKVNSMVYYLRNGKFVLARIKQKIHKNLHKFWYNVEHLDESIPDKCVDFENPEDWKYPEELDKNWDVRTRTVSDICLDMVNENIPVIVVSPPPEDSDNVSLVVASSPDGDVFPPELEKGRVGSCSDGELSLPMVCDPGSPVLRTGLRSSSPIDASEECDKEMEKNIDQFNSDSSFGRENGLLNAAASSERPSSQFLEVSQAPLTPFKQPSQLSISGGSDLDL